MLSWQRSLLLIVLTIVFGLCLLIFCPLCSNVPTTQDVAVPETLLKKQKADAADATKAAAAKAELRKVRSVDMIVASVMFVVI